MSSNQHAAPAICPELPAAERPADTASMRPAGRVLVGVALALAAFSLRPAMASVGPLLDEIRHGIGMSSTGAGLLTSLPAACFAAFGALAPRLARRVGPGAVACGAMAVITLGLLLRTTAGGSVTFLLYTAVAVTGIGIGNVVMPIVVKRYFPDRVGPMTGVYSTALTVGAALAAASSVPLSRGLRDSWRLGLGFWAIPAAVATVAWLAVRRSAGTVATSPTPVAPPSSVRLTRSPTAWALSIFFGLQAAGAYVVLGWMSQIFRDAGVPAETAGLLLALTPTVGIPLAFLIPTLAARLGNQSALAAALTSVGLIGYGGLWLAPATTPWLWAVLLGISQASFPLALTMIGLRSGSTQGVAQLSAFVQGTGYLISIPCPIVVGALHQHTGGWAVPLAFMAFLLVPQFVAGILAGRDRTAEAECGTSS